MGLCSVAYNKYNLYIRKCLTQEFAGNFRIMTFCKVTLIVNIETKCCV